MTRAILTIETDGDPVVLRGAVTNAVFTDDDTGTRYELYSRQHRRALWGRIDREVPCWSTIADSPSAGFVGSIRPAEAPP